MGGRIGVHSAPGQGSQFWFSVPLDRPSPQADPRASAVRETERSARLDGIRVLLAEDNPINQDVALTMLQSLGCRVRVVDNGVKALAALAESEFDIVLMDWQMPGMDGFDTTAEIRAGGLLRPTQPRGATDPVRLPVIGLTASALKGDRELCIGAGMDDYLAKPYRRDALRSILERWVLDYDSRQPAAARTPETFDRSTLERSTRSQRAAGPRMAAGVIDEDFRDAPALIQALESACQSADTAAVAQAARTLAMRSEFVGAQRLAAMCAELESAGPAALAGNTDPRVPAIQREFDAVRVAMMAVRAGH